MLMFCCQSDSKLLSKGSRKNEIDNMFGNKRGDGFCFVDLINYLSRCWSLLGVTSVFLRTFLHTRNIHLHVAQLSGHPLREKEREAISHGTSGRWLPVERQINCPTIAIVFSFHCGILLYAWFIVCALVLVIDIAEILLTWH